MTDRESAQHVLANDRSNLDQIDREIVRLFEARMETAKSIAKTKQKLQMEVLDPAREASVLKTRSSQVQNAEYAAPVVQLFQTIMRLSREEQNRIIAASRGRDTVAYCGLPGAYSEYAAVCFFGQEQTRQPYPTFESVLSSVADETVGFGVLPIENSCSGSVNEVYDLLDKYDCRIVGEVTVPIEHCLLGLPLSRLEDIHTVFSHEQGFLQCQDYLSLHQGWRCVPYYNTAIAAKRVAELNDVTCAAIASRMAAAHYQLSILDSDIQSKKDNSTRFLIVSAKPADFGIPDKATLTFTLPHERGTLMRALAAFVALGMNLTSIQSRPLSGSKWQYRFYVDLTGNIQTDSLQVLMRALQNDGSRCKLLGVYKSAAPTLGMEASESTDTH